MQDGTVKTEAKPTQAVTQTAAQAVTQAAPQVEHCLNCGEPLTLQFCPRCGQEKTPRIVPVSHLLRDVGDEFFKFDSKLLATLKPLLLRPGFLTNEYIAGRRVRYIAPFRLYFVITALWFLVFSLTGAPNTLVKQMTVKGYNPGNQNARMPGSPNTLKEPASSRKTAAAPASRQLSRTTPARDNSALANDPEVKRFEQTVTRYAQSFLNNLSLVAFLMMPLVALLLKLIYWRTRRLYIEHLVFAVHLNTFVFVVWFLLFLPIPKPMDDIIALGTPLIYLILALRAVYRESGWKTLGKAILLLFSYGMILIMALIFGTALFFFWIFTHS